MHMYSISNGWCLDIFSRLARVKRTVGRSLVGGLCQQHLFVITRYESSASAAAVCSATDKMKINELLSNGISDNQYGVCLS